MNRTTRYIFATFSFALLVPLANGRTAGAEGRPARIIVHQRQFIEKESGKPFVPFGVSYYRPGTGWAPRLWKEFDADATIPQRPDLPWDACTTSSEAMEKFRQAYLAAFLAGRKSPQ